MAELHWLVCTAALVLTVLAVKGAEVCDARPCEVTMRTDLGWLCGRVRRADGDALYASFRRIPYGKPPIGANRYKDLVPPDPWTGLLDCTEEGPACPQTNMEYGHIPLLLKGMSEDCMHINLHIPYEAFLKVEQCQKPQSGGLPILVFIHGGGFQCGSGLTDLHGPEYMMSKNAIVVTFNYRINIFGYLSLNNKHIPGNQGLRDIIKALQWVKTNAKYFGGNPDDVTLMGQSAGAANAHILSLSKAARGLFKRVILMSGTGLEYFYSASPKYAKLVADMFLSTLGITSSDPAYIIHQLTTLPLNKIMYANSVIQYELGLTSLVPTVESNCSTSAILDDYPINLLKRGRAKNYPFIIGFTDAEGEFFKWLIMHLGLLNRIDEDPRILLPLGMQFKVSSGVQYNLANSIMRRYFGLSPTLEGSTRYYGDAYFKYPAIAMALEQAKVGNAPVYLYEYSYKSQYSVVKQGLWADYEGAAHVEDLTYVFRVNSILDKNYKSYPATTPDDRMKDWMTNIITNFMRCSNPTCRWNETEQMIWPPVTPTSLRYQSIRQPREWHIASPTGPMLDMINFFNGILQDAK